MSDPVLQEENGRNPDGTFKKGFTANPNGRPPKRRIESYITEEDVIGIVEKAKEEARAGKPELLKELLSHIFGKPRQPLVGGEDGDAPLVVNIIRKDGNSNPA